MAKHKTNKTSNDPVADFLTRIRNAVLLKKQQVSIPYSNFKYNLAQLFKQEGYLNDVQIINEDQISAKSLILDIRYSSGISAITGLRKLSSPGLRRYIKAKYAPRVRHGLGISVISTNKGLLTDRQAREQKLGGELVCQVW